MTGLRRFIRPQRFCLLKQGGGHKNHVLERCRTIAGPRLLCTPAEGETTEGAQTERPLPPKYTKMELPQLMETMKTGTIEEWKIDEGSPIEINMDLCLVDTELAQFYLHAPCDGVLAKIIAKEGEEVEVGGTVAILVDSPEHIEAAIKEYGVEHPSVVSEGEAKAASDARVEEDAEALHQHQKERGQGAPKEKEFEEPDGSKDGEIGKEDQQTIAQEARSDAIKKWTPNEVEKWLLALGFDRDNVVSKLKHYKGKDLLRLKREDAEHYFGLEGIRLVNEIEDLLSSPSSSSKEDAPAPSS